MKWTKIGASFDDRISGAAELISRRMTRRDALRTAVIGGATGIAVLTLGERPSLAASCVCGPSGPCSGCPSAIGCPSGYTTCYTTSGCACDHTKAENGQWVQCTGIGKCHLGSVVCHDCKKNSGCGVCICQYTVCLNCCNAAEVKAEMARLGGYSLSRTS